MARIAFILLCHKDPEGIVAQAERLTAAGDCIAIHFDARAPRAAYERITSALAGNPAVTFAARRVRCGWGEWSLVEATLAAVEAAVAAFPAATHFYMLSGDCMSIKSARFAHDFLDRAEKDYIESFDFLTSDWIKTGMKEERLIYRHWFNERTQKRLFNASFEAQRWLGLKRAVPADLQVMIGSQWWCLRRRTIEAVLEFCRERRDVVRFFRSTWIPDETFFQTLVRHLVPDAEIDSRTLTFLMFTDYGMPVTFYDDHYELLVSQDYLFARKISVDAVALKARLGELWADDGARFSISNEGRSLFQFLTGRGRLGRRYAPRFWETEASLGRERELLLVVCKKWHVAKRLVEQMRQVTGLPAVDYVFNEESAPLPDLGGIQTTLGKRTRHRRALLRMLYDWYGTDRMVVCLDPAAIELMRDFYADRCRTRLLHVECELTDDYLLGHARRIGLAGEATPADVADRLLPTIQYDVRFEAEQIRDAGFPDTYRIRERDPAAANAEALAAFLSISGAAALTLASTDHLFSD
ncbi:DUF5928 domain-containing protein [Frigidibacter sp. MR17.14]|uniref:DUF5928 domain-containing protein n=1 Tax=Frigidibacter sp. MR17.14 TaxID=3126509 RepID=UPI00301315F6